MPSLIDAQSGWYCFQALPKKEHIAASLVKADLGMESYCPRISRVKRTRRGKVKYVESLFPCYLFIKGNISENYRKIQSIQGIRKLISYGDIVPEVPEEFIEELQRLMGGETNIKELPEDLPKAGEAVTFSKGAFRNIEVILTTDMKPNERVGVLLDLLGRELIVKIDPDDLIYVEKPIISKIWE